MQARTNIIAAMRAHLPALSECAQITRVATGKFNESWYVRDATFDLIIRIAPPPNVPTLFYETGMMAQEPEIHRLLRTQTTIPVPRILAYDDRCELLPSPFIIMERLPGVALSAAPQVDIDHVFHQVGGYLAQLHWITRPQFGYLGEHHPMPPQDSWFAAFALMWERLIADVASTGHYSAADQGLLLDLLQQYRSAFPHLPAASLLHMDVWAENILVDPATSRVTGLIDWDRALWGDPEIEFAVLDYCGVSTPAFWQGYGRERPQDRQANIRHFFYYLYEVQKYIFIRHHRSHDTVAARRYRNYVFELVDRFVQAH